MQICWDLERSQNWRETVRIWVKTGVSTREDCFSRWKIVWHIVYVYGGHQSRNFWSFVSKKSEKTRWMQVNCTVHEAHVIQNFLEESGVSVLQWPTYSPDFKIIVNLWAIVKRRLQKEQVTWRNLEETVIRVWGKNWLKTIRKRYQSMRSRINACVKSRGATIGY